MGRSLSPEDALDAWLDAVSDATARAPFGHRVAPRALDEAKPLFAARGARAADLIRELAPRLDELATRWRDGHAADDLVRSRAAYALHVHLLTRRPTLSWTELTTLLVWHTETAPRDWSSPAELRKELLRRVRAEAPPTELHQALREHAERVGRRIPPAERKRLRELVRLADAVPFEDADEWVDVLRDRCEGDAAVAWRAVLRAAVDVRGARPTAKWQGGAQDRVEAVCADELVVGVTDATEAYTASLSSRAGLPDEVRQWNDAGLAGLLWHLPHVDAGTDGLERVWRAVGELAIAGYRLGSDRRPRAQKVANACVSVLAAGSGEAALHALALLRLRARDKRLLRRIEDALTKALERVGLDHDSFAEQVVPTFGLTEVGRRRLQLGDVVAELTAGAPHGLASTRTALTWTKARADGSRRVVKSVPAEVRRDHRTALAELRSAAKELQRVLSAHRERIDALFVVDPEWDFETWRARYLDHVVLGTLARGLIWELRGTGNPVAACWNAVPADGSAGRLEDLDGRPLQGLGPGVTVRLWHPIRADAETITAWRDRLATLRITQPMKQAHREVYRLTDAERATRTYSNRFAAHVLEQHQFHALARTRRWDDRLRLMVDDVVPATTRRLPECGLRAEFWVEPVQSGFGGDSDVNERGTYLRVATDQVRFYAMDAPQRMAAAYGGGFVETDDDRPLPLDDVPELVFSEVMRDVDLFVGVAGIGNDPEWEDGRLDGDLDAYWREYSFGRLSATAQTRRETVAALVPRLAIGPRCSVDGRFLVVRGDLRTYRIHLGSGNILMDPGSEYLCIVPDSAGARRDALAGGKVFLPFEGDRTLSIVLSKALMLANDTAITDPTIVSQIRSGRLR